MPEVPWSHSTYSNFLIFLSFLLNVLCFLLPLPPRTTLGEKKRRTIYVKYWHTSGSTMHMYVLFLCYCVRFLLLHRGLILMNPEKSCIVLAKVSPKSSTWITSQRFLPGGVWNGSQTWSICCKRTVKFMVSVRKGLLCFFLYFLDQFAFMLCIGWAMRQSVWLSVHISVLTPLQVRDRFQRQSLRSWKLSWKGKPNAQCNVALLCDSCSSFRKMVTGIILTHFASSSPIVYDVITVHSCVEYHACAPWNSTHSCGTHFAYYCREYLAEFKKTVAMHEVFLSRIAGHPRLRNEHNFRVFLEYKEEVRIQVECEGMQNWLAPQKAVQCTIYGWPLTKVLFIMFACSLFGCFADLRV